MLILDKILDWANESLNPWQQDAVRRLFEKQELDSRDYDDLYAMLKSAHGLPDTKNRQPAPLSRCQAPERGSAVPHLTLRSLRSLRNVNKIAPLQNLEFGEGLTVIYGPNASGKSGYARVLKRACRARDSSEVVLPDATVPKTENSIPEAIFDVEIDGQAKEIIWKQDKAAPDELSSIAIFDTRCARAYLSEGEAAFLPYGLDILENLAQHVFPELSQRLKKEISDVNVDKSAFQDFTPETTVSKIVAELSGNTDKAELRTLATLSADDRTRLGYLENIIKEADPIIRARNLRLVEKRITSLAEKITTAANPVGDSEIQRLRMVDQATEEAIKLEADSAQLLSGDSPLLPGTGSAAWKSLFDAARQFSVKQAYPDHEFPHVGPEARCPLCQQNLGDTASKRLRRFDEFVKQTSARTAEQKRAERKKCIDIIEQSVSFDIDPALDAEIKEIEPSLLKIIDEYRARLEKRKKWILEAFENHTWEGMPDCGTSPVPEIKTQARKFSDEAAGFEEASNPGNRETAKKEFVELQSRNRLSQRIKPLLELVDRMAIKDKLEKCKSDLDTRSISEKVKEFTTQAVTQSLETALNKEFEKLNIEHIKTKLIQKGMKGKTLYKLVLDLPAAGKLEDILSEGEQRAIAIGSFLAELQLAEHKGGIVFDDPVSSLDHDKRQKVANRLVAEAKARQVIIFTHDTVFLGELDNAAVTENITPYVSYLEWSNGRPGVAIKGLPWEHQSIKDRFNRLEKEHKILEQVWQAYPDDNQRRKMCEAYGLLRATMERVIEEVIFNGTIRRYRDWVQFSNLKGVVGFSKQDYDDLAKLYKKCCDTTDAHDHSSCQNAALPTPTDLAKDIASLKSTVDAIKNRRNNTARVGMPASP